MTCIASITYLDPDISAQQAVGMAIAVLNKMVDDTDNQKKVDNAENETALCSTRYIQANIRRISSLSFHFEVVIDSESAVIKTF